MSRKDTWARVQRVHEYCDICVNRAKCDIWCYGEEFQQDDSVLVKRGLISRFLSWIKGESSGKEQNNL